MWKGSLLCLTNDNFKTAYFAIVFDRDTKSLDVGKVLVKFDDWISINNNFLLCNSNKSNNNFVMVETLAYFESYRYTLESLKMLKETNFPFKKYLVYSQNDSIDYAKFLNGKNVAYDFRPLIRNSFKLSIVKEKESYSIEKDGQKIIVPKIVRKRYEFIDTQFSKVDVMQSQLWPTSNLLGLNE